MLLLWLYPLAVAAAVQDTIPTADIEFKPAEKSAPADSMVSGTAQHQSQQKLKAAAVKPQPASSASQTLGSIFLAGFLGGLAALLMPCIFPMLPLTVSYFTKSTTSRAKAIRTAVFYALSIIFIYVVLGLAITIVFGADALNSLSTNGVFNFVFFLLLVGFATSFLGAFELTLPAKWVNRMDEQSDKGGLLGIFFMAATLSLVSFSCTGPIIGTLLVQAAVSGALLGPAIGMLGFSLALAIPFALFAMFPSWLGALPKSGGWLNSVKVTLGFLELALALKFLSNVDLAYRWHWFDREIFLVLWIVIFGLMGLYLLGKLKFSHDSTLAYLTVPRLFLAMVVLAFTLYMVPGLWGAPLKSISAFLPPQSTQDFDLYTASLTAGADPSAAAIDNTPRKYAGLFEKPAGLNPFFDYAEGVAYAKKVGKPVMIDFTGHACVNCRKMEANVWTDKAVLPVIRDQYVLIQLYVDDKEQLPAAEQYTSKFSGRRITTIGALNSDIQASRFNSNSQPFYVLLNPQTEQPLTEPQGADFEVSRYLQYLQRGLSAFRP
ncbi:cytochrome c biogenesis protein CcdA [Mucilaginibacter sp. CSA2-8R]|uniref:protein-disulfide reductase DsbD family protein n=1 Tax=Mucilaginibacter sp. CSA2-8R TaxID=3141542 RepID=UPI00315C8467